MPGVLQVAQGELAASVRIAVPDFIGVRDPSFTSGVGILQNAVRQYRVRSQSGNVSAKKPANRTKSSPAPEKEQKPGFIERLKNMFSEFI